MSESGQPSNNVGQGRRFPPAFLNRRGGMNAEDKGGSGVVDNPTIAQQKPTFIPDIGGNSKAPEFETPGGSNKEVDTPVDSGNRNLTEPVEKPQVSDSNTDRDLNPGEVVSDFFSKFLEPEDANPGDEGKGSGGDIPAPTQTASEIEEIKQLRAAVERERKLREEVEAQVSKYQDAAAQAEYEARKRALKEAAKADPSKFSALDPVAVDELATNYMAPVLEKLDDQFEARMKLMQKELENVRAQISELDGARKRDADRLTMQQVDAIIYARHPDAHEVISSPEFKRLLNRKMQGKACTLGAWLSDRYKAGDPRELIEVLDEFAKRKSRSLNSIAGVGPAGVATKPSERQKAYTVEEIAALRRDNLDKFRNRMIDRNTYRSEVVRIDSLPRAG